MNEYKEHVVSLVLNVKKVVVHVMFQNCLAAVDEVYFPLSHSFQLHLIKLPLRV